MKLRIKRVDNDSLSVTSDKFGLMLILQGTTSSEYTELLKNFQTYFQTEPVAALYYSWKSMSIFIFDVDIPEMSKEMKSDIRMIADKQNFAIINNGKVEKGSTLNGLHIRESKSNIFIGKKFTGFLTMDIVN